MKHNKVAYRYAKSIFGLANEQNCLDQVFEDMQLLASAIPASKDLELMLSSPVVHNDKKTVVLNQVFAGKIGELTQKFMDIVVSKNRGDLLRLVAEKFVALVKEHKGIVIVEITSAIPMNDEMRSKIAEVVSKITDKTIEYVEKVDPAIIGGFVLKSNDQMIDSSVATQFNKLKREFAENPYISEM